MTKLLSSAFVEQSGIIDVMGCRCTMHVAKMDIFIEL